MDQAELSALKHAMPEIVDLTTQLQNQIEKKLDLVQFCKQVYPTANADAALDRCQTHLIEIAAGFSEMYSTGDEQVGNSVAPLFQRNTKLEERLAALRA